MVKTRVIVPNFMVVKVSLDVMEILLEKLLHYQLLALT